MSALKARIESLKNTTSDDGTKTYNYSVKKMEDFLDKKIVNMYDRPWQKLEYGLKINKIKEYLKLQNLTEIDYESQLKILSSAVKYNHIKSANIKYSDCKIEWIKL